MRVLLVDDSDSIERFVRAALKPEGWTLERAATGMDAMRLAIATKPDVLLIDFHLPDMDGLETLKLLQTAGVRSPAILLSGAQNPDVIRRFLAAGVADHLAKEDMSAERLRASIRQCANVRVLVPQRAQPPARALDGKAEAYADVAPRLEPDGAVLLLIDDTVSFRALLRAPLAARGWTIVEAGDAKSAIAMAAQTRPDVILLDHLLPDADGLSVLRAVRELGLAARVIAFTAHGDEGLAETFLREGAVDYLSKGTLTIQRLEIALERALWLGGARVSLAPSR